MSLGGLGLEADTNLDFIYRNLLLDNSKVPRQTNEYISAISYWIAINLMLASCVDERCLLCEFTTYGLKLVDRIMEVLSWPSRCTTPLSAYTTTLSVYLYFDGRCFRLKNEKTRAKDFLRPQT